MADAVDLPKRRKRLLHQASNSVSGSNMRLNRSHPAGATASVVAIIWFIEFT